jgi:hypothetical protein
MLAGNPAEFKEKFGGIHRDNFKGHCPFGSAALLRRQTS